MEWPVRITRQLAYFREGALSFNPPCPWEQLTALEQELTIQLPLSLQHFLLQTDGIGLMDMRVLGRAEIQEQTLCHRERSLRQRDVYGDHLEPEERQPEQEIVIGRDSSGDIYVLLNGLQPKGSEAPVAKFDHETGTIM